MITEDIKNAISTLYKVVPSKTTMPILQNILFRTENGRLELTANDLEKSLTLYVNTEKEYNTCVPAKTINELLSIITSPEIDITQKENKIAINRKPGKTTISTMKAENFPASEIDAHNIFDIDAQLFASSLKKCLISVSEDKSHPTLCGVLLKSENGILILSGVDGYRMTYIKLLFGLPDFEVILPKESAQVLISVLKTGKANIAINNNKISFITPDFKFTSQLIAGNFPQMERVIPQSWETEIEIDKAQLTRAIKTALIFAKDVANVCIISIENGTMQITGTSNETGKDKTPIDSFTIEGKEITNLGINGRYLLDGLTLTEKKVIIKLNGINKPIGLFLSDDSLFTHLIMPMHVKQ